MARKEPQTSQSESNIPLPAQSTGYCQNVKTNWRASENHKLEMQTCKKLKEMRCDHILKALQMHPLMFLNGSYHVMYFASSVEVKYLDVCIYLFNQEKINQA